MIVAPPPPRYTGNMLKLEFLSQQREGVWLVGESLTAGSDAGNDIVLQGAGVKRREKLSGRFADALTWQVLATAALRRFEAYLRVPGLGGAGMSP